MTHRFSFQDNLDTTNRDEVTIDVQLWVTPEDIEIEYVSIRGNRVSEKDPHNHMRVATALGYSQRQLNNKIIDLFELQNTKKHG